MQLQTRFGLGDDVVAVRAHETRERTVCAVCKGTRWVQIPGASRDALCPEPNCNHGYVLGEKVVTSFETVFGTVGEVRARMTRTKHPDDDGIFDNYVSTELFEIATKVEYMLHETGIGSGTLWPAERVFADHAEALAYADEQGWVRSPVVSS